MMLMVTTTTTTTTMAGVNVPLCYYAGILPDWVNYSRFCLFIKQ